MTQPTQAQSKDVDANDKGVGLDFFKVLWQQRVNSRRRARRRRELEKLNLPRAALIVGAGSLNGIGGAVAAKVAAEGMRVYMAGRKKEKLEAAAQQIGSHVIPLVIDAGDAQSIAGAFERVVDDGFALELVVHNVGTNRPRAFLDISPEMLERSWRNDTASGFEVARGALSRMSEQGFGTVIFTGASASLRGKAGFAAFAQAKAGLRMLAQSLAREFGPQGIHVVHAVIDGAVKGDRLATVLPGYLESQGEDGSLDPAAIADAYWQLHQQHPSTWTHELDLRPFKENW